MPQKLPLRERFWKYLPPDRRPDHCWEWQGGKSNGYGCFRVGPRTEGAHRVMWKLEVGPIPDGLWVLHDCDNPPCCNPAHLFLGTDDDNNKDRARKGRSAPVHGELSPNSKLSEGDVQVIMHAAGTHAAIAERFQVTKTTVGDIKRRKTWTYLGGKRQPAYKQIGDRAANVKLTSKQVLEIRDRFAKGECTKTALSREYGVRDTTIHYIIIRRTWTHI